MNNFIELTMCEVDELRNRRVTDTRIILNVGQIRAIMTDNEYRSGSLICFLNEDSWLHVNESPEEILNKIKNPHQPRRLLQVQKRGRA